METRIIDVTKLKAHCPFCDEELTYVAYRAFVCKICQTGFSIFIKPHTNLSFIGVKTKNES